MVKRIALIGMLGLFLGASLPGYADSGYRFIDDLYSPEKRLSVFDRGAHFPEEFKPYVIRVCSEHPGYSRDEVAKFMIAAYQEVQKDKPEITMYQVADDVRRFTRDELGIELMTYLKSYVRSQIR